MIPADDPSPPWALAVVASLLLLGAVAPFAVDLHPHPLDDRRLDQRRGGIVATVQGADGAALFQRVDDRLHFEGSYDDRPAMDGASNIAWRGALFLTGRGTEYLCTEHVGALRVWLGDALIVDAPEATAPTVRCAPLDRVEGWYPLAIDYRPGPAGVQLSVRKGAQWLEPATDGPRAGPPLVKPRHLCCKT